LRGAVDDVLAAEGLREAVVRITVTRGVPGGRPVRTSAWVEAEALGGRLWAGTRTPHPDGGPLGARAIRSHVPFSPGWLGRHKTTSRLAWDLAREEARAADADEALLVSPAGELLEGAASNVFVVRADGVLVTPPLTADVLPGVTRGLTLAAARALGIAVLETPVRADELVTAREVFVTNSVQEVLPLRSLDGRPLPDRTLGLRLLAAHRERVTTR
jgi:branched-subunit amino acid aminotransferase/4-amino-4-deoxychorismate lyase